MENSNQAFTSATWNVKKGKEKEFRNEWNRFANWSLNLDKISAVLLQDNDNPSRFISFGKWNNEDRIKTWSQNAEFKNYITRLNEFLEVPSKPHTLKAVARVGEFEVV